MIMNWKFQSPKTRFIFLGIGIVLSLLLIYQLSLKLTFTEFMRNGQLKDQIQLYNSQIATDKNRTKQPNFTYEVISINNKHITRTNLFEELTKIGSTQKTEIESFEDHSQFEDENHTIETLRVELSGTYSSLLTSLYEIEKQNLSYIISAAEFVKVKNIKSKKNELILCLYFQILLKDES